MSALAWPPPCSGAFPRRAFFRCLFPRPRRGRWRCTPLAHTTTVDCVEALYIIRVHIDLFALRTDAPHAVDTGVCGQGDCYCPRGHYGDNVILETAASSSTFHPTLAVAIKATR